MKEFLRVATLWFTATLGVFGATMMLIASIQFIADTSQLFNFEMATLGGVLMIISILNREKYDDRVADKPVS